MRSRPFCTGYLAVFGLAVLLLPACAMRRNPYHFRAPLVASVHAPALRSRPAASDGDDRARPAARRRDAAAATSPPPVRTIVPSRPLDASAPDRLAQSLRVLVGKRDPTASDIAFALAALQSLGAVVDPAAAALGSGADLVELARRRDALAGDREPLLGDLVVFDNVVARQPASLIGVVVSSDSQGTIEFVYLARGVVRRGFVNPRRPEEKRDEAGRVLNTFVRHSDGVDPGGTRYLAGELFAGVVRLDRLLGRS